MRIERRAESPRRLQAAVPIGSVAVALVLSGIVLLATGHNPLHAYKRLFEAAFTDPGALSATLTAATPLCFTGLAAAVAFRVGLFNIGAEGQLYMGAIAAAGVALALAGQGVVVQIAAMVIAGGVAGAAWALIPGFLRAFANTNEIITSLMLNYVAALFLNYLIFDTISYWRDTSSPSLVIPFGLLVATVLAGIVLVLYKRTRFGFEAAVIGDSPRAARYAGMRTRRSILLVMGLSGLLAGVGGASQDGDFRHLLDPRGLQQPGYGYTGIVVAALARYNPFAVVLVAFLIGGLSNAGYALQGVDFPAGLVGVMQGVILFCALGGELLVRYRVRFGRAGAAEAATAA
jgi:simple sugar transport system permease protein